MGRMEARDSDKHEAAMFFMVPMKCQIARRERGRREMGGSGVARRNLIRSAGFPSHFLGWVGDCVLWCVGGGEEGGEGTHTPTTFSPGKRKGEGKASSQHH